LNALAPPTTSSMAPLAFTQRIFKDITPEDDDEMVMERGGGACRQQRHSALGPE
jgi:hypothetical protein